MVDGNLGFFIYVFSSIFVIVSPIGGVVTFISLTSQMTLKEKNEVAKKAVTTCMCNRPLFCNYRKHDT